MTFESALIDLKQGHKIRRQSWVLDDHLFLKEEYGNKVIWRSSDYLGDLKRYGFCGDDVHAKDWERYNEVKFISFHEVLKALDNNRHACHLTFDKGHYIYYNHFTHTIRKVKSWGKQEDFVLDNHHELLFSKEWYIVG